MAGPSREYEAKPMIRQHIKAASAANYSCLFIGQDRKGHWIVKDAQSLCGGLFASKDAAIHFARFESADRQSTIRLASDPLELNCSS